MVEGVSKSSLIGVRIKHVVAMSRLPERGGRPAARESADRAGLVASLERDKAATFVTVPSATDNAASRSLATLSASSGLGPRSLP